MYFTAETLITKDVEWCEKYGATSVFVALRKPLVGETQLTSATATTLDLVCPECKGGLENGDKGHRCAECGKQYPSFQGIPVLIPYHQEVPQEVFDIEGKIMPEVSC